MHYLEDYLEIVELLPSEVKARLLQIQKLDEKVQGQLESLNDRTKTFFTLSRKNKQDWREHQYQSLLQEYEKCVSESSEKVKLSTDMCELFDRHLRRLDQDLNRFTIELEADTAGITELLEQKSYELDKPPSPEKPQPGHKRLRPSLLQPDDFTNGEFEDFSPPHSNRGSPTSSSRSLKRERLSALNISSENENDFLTDLEDHLPSPSSLYTGTGGKPPLAFVPTDTKSNKKRSSIQNTLVIPEPVQDTVGWLDVDPNEPRYCLCNQVSYGEMVGCDNAECPIEWFHYGCVGITEPPKGKWYCPQCTISMKKKGARRN